MLHSAAAWHVLSQRCPTAASVLPQCCLSAALPVLSHDYSCLAVQGAQREAAATAERLDLAEGRCRSRVRVGPELGQGCARVPCHPGGAAAHCPGLCVAGSLGAWPRCALGTNPRAAQGYSGRLAAPAVRPRPESPMLRPSTPRPARRALRWRAAVRVLLGHGRQPAPALH